MVQGIRVLWQHLQRHQRRGAELMIVPLNTIVVVILLPPTAGTNEIIPQPHILRHLRMSKGKNI